MERAALAHQVLDVCLGLTDSKKLWIDTWNHALELASYLGSEADRRGHQLLLTTKSEEDWFHSLIEGPLEAFEHVPPQQAAALEETDAFVFTLGPSHPIPWNRVPAGRHKAATIWFLEDNSFVKEWMAIATRRRVRMLGLEATLATPARAQALSLEPEAWSEAMLEGCMADYREVADRGRALAPLLGGTEEVHVTSPHGTDLRFRLDRRRVIVNDGLATEEKAAHGQVVFLPAGDLEVTAEEESAEGVVVYDQPIHSAGGAIERLTLSLSEGRIVKAEASLGLDVFERQVREGEGDVDRFAFFGFGLNPRLRHGFTQDDKVLGGLTIGFGRNQDKGGRNRTDRDWWASMTQATVTVGGRIVMEAGNLPV